MKTRKMIRYFIVAPAQAAIAYGALILTLEAEWAHQPNSLLTFLMQIISGIFLFPILLPILKYSNGGLAVVGEPVLFILNGLVWSTALEIYLSRRGVEKESM